jgi:hypothetical protein
MKHKRSPDLMDSLDVVRNKICIFYCRYELSENNFLMKLILIWIEVLS